MNKRISASNFKWKFNFYWKTIRKEFKTSKKLLVRNIRFF